MATFTRKQANSLWVAITFSNPADIDAIWTNFTGVYEVFLEEGLTATTIPSGTLIRSTTVGLFFLKLGPLNTPGWETLPVGVHKIVFQIDNTVQDYRHEESHTLKIIEQDLP
jgi:hypothetical protein